MEIFEICAYFTSGNPAVCHACFTVVYYLYSHQLELY